MDSRGVNVIAGVSLHVCIGTRDRFRADSWGRSFAAEGWSSCVRPAAEELLDCAAQERARLALIDARLLRDPKPVLDRFAAAGLPVILFALASEDLDDKIPGWLGAGADDFAPAEINEKVLCAKLAVYAKRMQTGFPRPTLIQWSPGHRIKLNRRNRTAWIKASRRGWKVIRNLTEKELALLSLFLAQPQRELSRAAILQSVWREKAEVVNPETLTKHVESLRKKLGPAGKAIRTIYGRGYMFSEDPK